MSGSLFFEERVAGVQGETFTVLNEFDDSESDNGSEPELFISISIPRRKFADLLKSIQKRFHYARSDALEPHHQCRKHSRMYCGICKCKHTVHLYQEVVDVCVQTR